jgi:hypothetical protein
VKPRLSRSEDRSTSRDSVRAVAPILRVSLYIVAGVLAGFLLLAEFALITFPIVQLAMLALALVGLVGALRGRVSLGLWSLFVVAAIVLPLLIDFRIVGLPRCGDVPPGIACLAGTRDVAGQFAIELLIFGCGIVGTIALGRRTVGHSLPSSTKIIDAGR